MITAKVTPEKFEELKEQLKAEQGLDLEGNKGTVASRGVQASYEYDGSAELRIEVTHAPFLVSKGFCEGKLREALTGHGVACA